MKVGFIGLGTMGLPMTANLVKAGFEVVVWNRTASKADDLVARGAVLADSPGELAAQCEVVGACLLLPQISEEIFLGPGGVIDRAAPGSILIDFSSNGTDTAIKCYEAAKAKGQGYLDAPISGGPWGAEAGTLAIMIGGDKEVFDRAQPVLDVLGGNVTLMGGPGAGSVTKMANQVIFAAQLAISGEAFVMAQKFGIDPELLLKVLQSATAASASLDRNFTMKIFNRDFEPAFSVDLLAKDLGLTSDLCRSLGVRNNIGALAESFMREAQAAGNGGMDITAAVLTLERHAGVEVRPTG